MERILEFGGKRFWPDIRRLYDMKEVIYDKEFLSQTENIELYYMYRNVFLDESDKKLMEEKNLRYDVTIIPPMKLGKEFVKTAGHYHPFVPGTKITYPEVYEVLEGEAHYLLQKKEDDKTTDVVLISAEKNDKVIIPPGYAHVTINPSKKLLKMANWVASNFSSVYEPIKKMHGAAYFRRWHRRKENSGGLLVHKACHCFDLINWFVGAKPKEVFATGDIVFYGKNGKFRGKRCYGCMHSKKCDFYFNLLSSEKSKQLYFDAEKSDGYIRDACVFDKEINIEDTANVLYKYKNGTFANFSLVAYCGCEGIDIVIEGTKGRLEYNLTSDTQWLAGQKSIIHGLNKQIGKRLLFYPFRGKFTEVKIKESKGAHGGGDPRIQRDLFFTDWPKMGAKGPLASVEQAVDAILIGDAANKSIKTGKVIKI